ncbi:GntR family transcriptional regulator [Mesobacterium sp. TK19101]|uniref:GntR family transcriptional regulator n=1 Tax=Mesobacterium hydrothermale TaxID=3111907 RepID=A0ABU6HMR9_9RHOB|nr:GntR family transcriptional regulator [Mesobacterium sp. TK19101]MEC3863151.1 GntR family transcriptional regulator [Mesobacterium sp. TK19101]
MPSPSAALPKYAQISEMLIREIAAGRLADGAKLPPERQFAAELGISVGTLRKALDDLADKGMLRRVQGSGNYVRHRPDPAGIYAFFRLELVDGGGLPTAEYLDIARLEKPAELPAFGTSRDGHRIRRLRRLSGQPAALEEIWLDGVWAEKVDRDDISESLYLFYSTRLDLLITSAEDRVSIDLVPAWRVDQFAIAAGQPCGFVERWGRTADGEVAEFSRTWFDPSVVRYVARMR